jgi:hypothetical protein
MKHQKINIISLFSAVGVFFFLIGLFDFISKPENALLSLDPINTLQMMVFGLSWGLGWPVWLSIFSASLLLLIPPTGIFWLVKRGLLRCI